MAFTIGTSRTTRWQAPSVGGPACDVSKWSMCMPVARTTCSALWNSAMGASWTQRARSLASISAQTASRHA